MLVSLCVEIDVCMLARLCCLLRRPVPSCLASVCWYLLGLLYLVLVVFFLQRDVSLCLSAAKSSLASTAAARLSRTLDIEMLATFL